MQFSKRKSKENAAFAVNAGLGLFVFLCAVLMFSLGDNNHQVESSILAETDNKPKTIRAVETTKSLNAVGDQQPALRDDLVRDGLSAEDVWFDLVQEGRYLVEHQKPPGIVMEVGMHRAIQCVQAAKAGMEAHCVEPSPKSFERVQYGVKKAPPDVQSRVHLYNVAAGGTSEGSVPFTSSGGTGDHVGGHDMWAMSETKQTNDKSIVINVPSKRLDDIIHDTGDNAFLLKVDTQGFEPTVFSGLTDSLKEHNIQFVLTEFWPRGMDLLAGKPDECIGAHLLQGLADMGYILYAMPVAAHPRAPSGWQQSIPDRPLDDLSTNCQWYFDVEKQFPSDEYKMGYWSDILAVAPGRHLKDPQTKTGRALAQHQ